MVPWGSSVPAVQVWRQNICNVLVNFGPLGNIGVICSRCGGVFAGFPG